MEVLFSNLGYLLRGAVVTIELAVACLALSTVMGLLLGVAAFMGPLWLRAPITVYVFTIRGIPVLVLMFLGYFGLPALGIDISSYVAVGGALTLYSGSYVTEIVRGVLLTIDQGQILAGRSIGLRWWQLLWHVQAPQAIKLALPQLLNNAVIMVKATSYSSIVGVWEMTYASREIVERTLAPFQIFLGVMVIYFAICYPLGLLSRRLEKRFMFSL
jgi:polar amino acid transport system permease protein